MPPEPAQPDLAEVLSSLAAEHADLAQGMEALGKRIAEVAACVWDARVLSPPEGAAVRPKLYGYAAEAARRIARRGDRLNVSRLLAELRDVDCVAVKEHEREPLWAYVGELTGAAQ